MYISVPKNYGGNAFPHPDAKPRGEGGGMQRPVPPFADYGAQAQPTPPPPPPPPDCGCPPSCEGCEPCGEHAPEAGQCPCGDASPCHAENKNPLTCLFEALRGRKKSGFDADDFLLIGLIALLMGKEGSEDIVLILALLLLV